MRWWAWIDFLKPPDPSKNNTSSILTPCKYMSQAQLPTPHHIMHHSIKPDELCTFGGYPITCHHGLIPIHNTVGPSSSCCSNCKKLQSSQKLEDQIEAYLISFTLPHKNWLLLMYIIWIHPATSLFVERNNQKMFLTSISCYLILIRLHSHLLTTPWRFVYQRSSIKNYLIFIPH